MHKNGKAYCDRCGESIPWNKKVQLCKGCVTWLDNYVKEKECEKSNSVHTEDKCNRGN